MADDATPETLRMPFTTAAEFQAVKGFVVVELGLQILGEAERFAGPE